MKKSSDMYTQQQLVATLLPTIYIGFLLFFFVSLLLFYYYYIRLLLFFACGKIMMERRRRDHKKNKLTIAIGTKPKT